jgi:hypothetical protein
MYFIASVATASAGVLQIWLASKWEKLSRLQKIALVSLLSPTICFALILMSS